MRCSWPGCKNKAQKLFKSFSDKPAYYTKHCSKHNYMKLSGRVSSGNYLRDSHREHMTDVCAISGDTFSSKMPFVKRVLSELLGYRFENEKRMIDRIYQKRHAIAETMRLFEVDHIDGNRHNNNPDNYRH